MPKYSVKKPFTILVAVILVLVLGVVSLPVRKIAAASWLPL